MCDVRIHESSPYRLVVIKNMGITFKSYILPRCGHSSFYEKEWSDKFNSIIVDIMNHKA